MNELDSEVMIGQLETRGLVRSHDENDADRSAERIAQCDGREKIIGRHLDVIGARIEVEYPAQEKKEKIHDHQHRGKGHDILLRIADRLYADVLLHHLLVEPRHRDGDEHTTQYMFQKEGARFYIGIEYAGIALFLHEGKRASEIESHRPDDDNDTNNQAQQHARGLKRIGIDDRFYAAFECIEQDQHEDHQRRYFKGDPEFIENKQLQDADHQV